MYFLKALQKCARKEKAVTEAISSIEISVLVRYFFANAIRSKINALCSVMPVSFLKISHKYIGEYPK